MEDSLRRPHAARLHARIPNKQALHRESNRVRGQVGCQSLPTAMHYMSQGSPCTAAWSGGTVQGWAFQQQEWHLTILKMLGPWYAYWAGLSREPEMGFKHAVSWTGSCSATMLAEGSRGLIATPSTSCAGSQAGTSAPGISNTPPEHPHAGSGLWRDPGFCGQVYPVRLVSSARTVSPHNSSAGIAVRGPAWLSSQLRGGASTLLPACLHPRWLPLHTATGKEREPPKQQKTHCKWFTWRVAKAKRCMWLGTILSRQEHRQAGSLIIALFPLQDLQ